MIARGLEFDPDTWDSAEVTHGREASTLIIVNESFIYAKCNSICDVYYFRLRSYEISTLRGKLHPIKTSAPSVTPPSKTKICITKLKRVDII